MTYVRIEDSFQFYQGPEAREFARAQWEHARVEFVLKHFKIRHRRREILDTVEARSGVRHLNFAAFAAAFPTFPVELSTDTLADHVPLDRNKKAVLPYWFKSFESLPFVPPFLDLVRDRVDDGRIVGLIFPRRGFQQGLVIHNGDERFIPSQVSCFIHRRRVRKRDMTFYVLPFHVFLDQITWDG